MENSLWGFRAAWDIAPDVLTISSGAVAPFAELASRCGHYGRVTCIVCSAPINCRLHAAYAQFCGSCKWFDSRKVIILLFKLQ